MCCWCSLYFNVCTAKRTRRAAVSFFAANLSMIKCIKIDLTVEPLLELVEALAVLGQQPHHLGDDRLNGHVMGFQETEAVLDPFAHLVNAHIAALVGDLSGQDQDFVGLVVVAQPLGKGVHQPLRDAAHAKAFHDHTVVMLKDGRDQLGAQAGSQLEQKDFGVERPAKLHRAGGPGRGDIPHQPVALHQRQRREVDRRKGVIADGLVLFGAGARDDMPAEHHHHAPAPGVQRTDHAVPQVFLGVGDLIGDGLLGACQDDGLVGVLNEVRKGRRRVGQRIGAVADDEAIVEGVILLHSPGHHEPVLGAQVGAVDAAQRQCLGAAELLQLRQVGQQLLAGKDGLEPLGRAYTGNGAARGDKKQALLGHKMEASMKIQIMEPV